MAVRWLPPVLLVLQLTTAWAEPVVPYQDSTAPQQTRPEPGCLPAPPPPTAPPVARPDLPVHISPDVKFRIYSNKHLHELELTLDNLSHQTREVALPQWLTLVSAQKTTRQRLTREFRTTLQPGERRVFTLLTDTVESGTDWLDSGEEYFLASVIIPKPDPSESPPPAPAPPKVKIPPEMQLPNAAWKKVNAVVERPASGGRWYALGNCDIPPESIISIRRQGLKVNGGRVVGSFRNRILIEVWSGSQVQAGDEVLVEAVAVPPYRPPAESP